MYIEQTKVEQTEQYLLFQDVEKVIRDKEDIRKYLRRREDRGDQDSRAVVVPRTVYAKRQVRASLARFC
jgi:hypothetical protein